MQTEQNEIHEFMVKAGQATPDRPTMPPDDVCELRLTLIAEELQELAAAFGYFLYFEDDSREQGEPRLRLLKRPFLKPSLRDAYDATLDIEVVTIGTGVALGIQLQPGWDEVHRSNMSKFIDGHRRADGKWVKGPSYAPAVLQPIIDAQITAAEERDKQQALV